MMSIDLLCHSSLSNHFHLDLNPIRAAIAETLEQSDFTSAQRRIEALQESWAAEDSLAPTSELATCHELQPWTVASYRPAKASWPASQKQHDDAPAMHIQHR